jgi:hypothetical protein
MKRIFLGIALISGITLLSSCEEKVCIRCIKVSGTDTQELCSTNQSERHYFSVEWNKADYNCYQVSPDSIDVE